MKTVKASLFSLAVLLGLTMAAGAWAGGGHGGHGGGGHGGHGGGGHGGHSSVRVGVAFGVPGWGYPGPFYYSPWYRPYYYPSYPYYAPAYAPAAFAPVSPAYVEQGQYAPGPTASAAPMWYYCAESQAYYPYVNQCAGQWQRVPPQPPPS